MKIYLDLLPKNKKLEIKRKKRFLIILQEEFLFLFPLVVFIILLLNIWYLISLQRNVLINAQTKAQSEGKYKELSQYEKKFSEVNDVSSAILKIKSSHFHWFKMFEKLSDLTPDGIMITDLSTKNYRIFLLGRANNRDSLLEFKNKLESEECFESVNLPLSNLVVKENVDFQVDFAIKKDCLKQE